MVYGTKFGDIFWIPLVAVTLALVIPAIYFKGVFSAVLFLSVAAIDILWICVGLRTKYVFESDRLIVSMPIQVTEPPVYYESVKSIVIPGTRYYSHGLSRDTIGIHYGERGYVSISPVRKEEFVEILRNRCPQARFETNGS